MGTVLFTSVRPLERAENLKAVYDAYDGDKQYVQREYGKSIDGIHSGKYGLVVTDGLMDESPGKYLWIGHGMGAGKRIGLQHPYAPFRKSDLVTYAIASSVDMVPVVANFCGIPESRVIPLGMPRTDAYFGQEKEDKPYREYLYAPTFRIGRWAPDWWRLEEYINDDERFIVKPHMVTKTLLQGTWKNITEASADVPSTPYLLRADVVITDYSSIMFDAMVLRKPVVLFAKDRFNYLVDRGMYFPYPERYSKHFYDSEISLMVYARKAVWDDFCEELRQFYTGACDGHSTERTIDLIKSMLEAKP